MTTTLLQPITAVNFSDIAGYAVKKYGFSIIPRAKASGNDDGKQPIAINTSFIIPCSGADKVDGDRVPRVRTEKNNVFWSSPTEKTFLGGRPGAWSRTDTEAGVMAFAEHVAEDTNYSICSDYRTTILESDDEEKFRRLVREHSLKIYGVVRELPVTLTSYGRQNRPHWFFKRMPWCAVKPAPGFPGVFEWRNNNAYVAGFGSSHHSGSVYTLVDPDCPIAEFPEWLPQVLKSMGDVAPSATARTGVKGNKGEPDRIAFDMVEAAYVESGGNAESFLNTEAPLDFTLVEGTNHYTAWKVASAILHDGERTEAEILRHLETFALLYCSREFRDGELEGMAADAVALPACVRKFGTFVAHYPDGSGSILCRNQKHYNEVMTRIAAGTFVSSNEELERSVQPPTQEEWDALVAECAARGLKVIEFDAAGYVIGEYGDFLGEVKTNGACSSAETIEELEETPLPEYPKVWGGTLYADFAEVCRKGNHLPYEFLIESFKTVMGAVMGSSVKVEDSFGEIEGATPRFYTVLLADGMGGKGTSISYGTQVFEPPTGANGVGLVVPQSPLWSGNDEPLNTWTGCGAARTTFNSIPGLGQLSRQHRILQTYGELSQLMNSIGNEVAGDGLLAVLRDLYDDTRYEVGATARRGPLSGHVEHSILAGTTPKLWGVMFSKKQVGGSGLFQRFNLIPVETVKRTTLHRPNLLGIRTRLYEMLLELNGAPVVVHATAAAITMLDEWFRPFGENPELLADDFGRLNVLALRNALHLAFMKGTRTIGVSEMSDAIKLSEYQFRVRTRYRPATGHNDSARLEDEVRQMVKGVRKITLRDLKRKLREHGKWALDHAIKNLVDDKELTVHEKTPAHGGPKTIWLLYEADTSRSTGKTA